MNCRRLVPRGDASRHASGAQESAGGTSRIPPRMRVLQILDALQMPVRDAFSENLQLCSQAIAQADRVGLVELRDFRVVEQEILRALLAGIGLELAVDDVGGIKGQD